MRNRPIFIKVRNYVINHSYTIQQIERVPPDQVKYLLGLSDDEFVQYQKYEDGIKRILISMLQEEADVHTLADMKAQIHSWLSARFPGYEVEKDFSDKTNRKVTFYLDDKDVN
jgi:hypothetical protein